MTERIDLRQKNQIIWQNDSNPSQFSMSKLLLPVHYESEIDSGVFDSRINLTPVRVDNANFDGWVVSENGWHYALGKDLLNHGNQDGWVGFAGRKGQNWFKFRLHRVGYLHWPTKALQLIGGAPTYNRAKLSSTVNSVTIGPAGEQVSVNIGTVATWNDIWTTPSQGSFSAIWKASPTGLKEELIINQAARTWITNNAPPTTPLVDTYFGFVIQIDVSDIPQIIWDGVLQNLDEAEFSDDNLGVELRDALDRLLAFMPISDVYVEDANGDVISQPLKKRFYKDPDGNYYLLLGVRCDLLVGMPAGSLVFDPTINPELTASADDAAESLTGTNFNSGATTITIRANTTDSTRNAGGFFWDNITIPAGSTIDACDIQLYCDTTSQDDLDSTVDFNNVDDAANFSTEADVTGRPVTGNGVSWAGTALGVGYETSPSLVTPAQAIIDRAGWASGQAWVVIVSGDNAADARFRLSTVDGGTGNYAILDVTWTEPSGGVDVTPDPAIAGGDTVNPTVRLGSISLTPVVAVAGGDTVNPTVLLGSLSFTPTPALAGGDSTGPTVQLGSHSFTPVAASTGGDTTGPTVQFGSLSLTPVAADATATGTDPTVSISGGGEDVTPAPAVAKAVTVNPTVLLGSISLTPAVAAAGGDTVNPTVFLGSHSFIPTPASAGGDTAGPTVQLGSHSFTPAVVSAGGDTTGPTVQFGSLSLTPVAADATATGTDPTVSISGGGEDVTPAPAVVKSITTNPVVQLSSISLTPAAATAGGDTVNPVVQLGSLNITLAVAASGADTTDPTVTITGGGVNVTPAPATAGLDSVNPTVRLGSVSYTPAVAFAGGDSVGPTVRLGSISFTPVPAFAGADTTGPTVLEGGGPEITPDPATIGAGTTNPTVQFGSASVTPVPGVLVVTTTDPIVFIGSGFATKPDPVTGKAVTRGPVFGISVTPAPAVLGTNTTDPSIFLSSVSFTPAPAQVQTDTRIGLAAKIYGSYRPKVTATAEIVFGVGEDKAITRQFYRHINITKQFSVVEIIDDIP